MTPAQLSQIKANIEASEGRTSWLYRDSGPAGAATCGIGHLVPDFAACQSLPFLPPITGAEWARLLSEPRGCRASFYQTVTTGRLSDAAIDALLDQDVTERLGPIRSAIPGFDTLPDGPMAAVFDMAYNLGVSGLTKGYPHLMAALATRDWETCAAQCRRIGVSVVRNTKTAEMFSSAV